jgi:hypothetical protein
MKDAPTFAERLAPDTIRKFERAAQHRYKSANILLLEGRRLAALYLFGYTAEICLATAYFRSAGFSPNQEIDRDTRNRRMAQARLLETPNGERLMSRDPHPIIGWVRFLESRRILAGNLTEKDRQRLREAINKAVFVYSYWRPELRYKVVDIGDKQLHDVRAAAK